MRTLGACPTILTIPIAAPIFCRRTISWCFLWQHEMLQLPMSDRLLVTLGGWLGWWLGANVGLMTGFVLSMIGMGLSLYFAKRIVGTVSLSDLIPYYTDLFENSE